MLIGAKAGKRGGEGERGAVDIEGGERTQILEGEEVERYRKIEL